MLILQHSNTEIVLKISAIAALGIKEAIAQIYSTAAATCTACGVIEKRQISKSPSEVKVKKELASIFP